MKKMNDKIQKSEFTAFYICSFFVYCVIGWIYEVAAMYNAGYGFVNRGFLYGCYIPIYGFSSILFLILFSRMVKKKVKIKNISVTPVVIFILVFLLSSVIEYSASYILEEFFNLSLWSYEGHKYNLNGRISLLTSCYFGIGGLIIFYIVQPVLDRIRKHITPEITIIAGRVISVIMISDFIITVAVK